MMREIAARAGNFRGVCPSQNRAAEESMYRGVGLCIDKTGLLCAGFLLAIERYARNRVLKIPRRTKRVRSTEFTKSTSYV